MKKRLLATFLPLALIPLAGAGFISYKFAQKALIQKTFAELEYVALSQKSRIENIAKQNIERLELIADRVLLRIIVDRYLPFPSPKDHRKLNRLLEKISAASPDLKSISLLSPKGKVIASTDPAMIKKDFQNHPFFIRGKSKNTFDVVDMAKNRRYAAYFAGPLKQDSTLLGVLLIEENFEELFPWIKDYSGLGKTGESFLRKKLPNGEILYLTSLRFDSKASVDEQASEKKRIPLHLAFAGKDEPLIITTDYRGKDVITLTRFLKNLSWELVVKIDKDEAFAPVKNLRTMYLLLFLITIVSVGFLTHILAKSIVDPLDRLMGLAEDISLGKPSLPTPVIDRKDEIGKLANSFMTMAKNLLGSKEELEQKISQRTEELRQSRSFMNSVIENIPNMIFVKDAKNLKFVSLNKAGEKLLGVKREELLGKNDYDFFPREEADFFVAKDRQVLKNTAMLDIPEEPIHTKDGLRTLHTKKIPIIDEKGNPKYLLGISEDITERKQTEQTLLQKQGELARANAERGQLELFASVAAHDLQEPLRKIVAFGDLLMAECAAVMNPDGQDYLNRMRNAAKRMSELISDLLKFSKVAISRDTSSSVDLKTVLEEVLSDLELSVQESQAKFEVGELPTLYTNPVQMREVFQNLIGNAIKFRKKTEPLIISIQSRPLADGSVEITVADTGIGFDEKFSERIFKPFERLHRRSEYDGNGVGLAICQRIISNHGGRIMARSTVGKGSTFVITFAREACVKGETQLAAESTV